MKETTNEINIIGTFQEENQIPVHKEILKLFSFLNFFFKRTMLRNFMLLVFTHNELIKIKCKQL